MAYLMSEDTAQWIKEQKKYNTTSGKRRGWIFGGGAVTETVSVCKINGGNPVAGYSAIAYPTMAALRDEEGGELVKIFPVEIGLDAALPQGTIVLCHKVQCRVTGGSENAEPEEQEGS